MLLKGGGSDLLECKGLFGKFNCWFDWLINCYVGVMELVVGYCFLYFGVFVVIVVLFVVLFLCLLIGFLLIEDQGQVMIQYMLFVGVMIECIDVVCYWIENYLLIDEKVNVKDMFVINGFSFFGLGQNVGFVFLGFVLFDDCKGIDNGVVVIMMCVMMVFFKICDVQVFVIMLLVILGFGQFNGFIFELFNISGLDCVKFFVECDVLIVVVSKDFKLLQVCVFMLFDMLQLKVDIDEVKFVVFGLIESDVIVMLSVVWGSIYINDFVDWGWVKCVYMQVDVFYCMLFIDFDIWFVWLLINGNLVFFFVFVMMYWEKGLINVLWFSGWLFYEIQGDVGFGLSLGDVMVWMVELQK